MTRIGANEIQLLPYIRVNSRHSRALAFPFSSVVFVVPSWFNFPSPFLGVLGG